MYNAHKNITRLLTVLSLLTGEKIRKVVQNLQISVVV